MGDKLPTASEPHPGSAPDGNPRPTNASVSPTASSAAVVDDDDDDDLDEATLSVEDKKRFEQLFNKLDLNNDGTVDIRELTAALQNVAASDASGKAQRVMSMADRDDNAVIDFDEFARYMLRHEKRLQIAFTSLDKNNDGKIEPSEIQSAFNHLGINLSMEDAVKLTKKIDKNNDFVIDWNEWRDYFGLYAASDLEEIVDIWQDRPMIDIGEQLTCPPDFQKRGGVSWKHLLAGGVAGAVSRTATAPLDRLKIMLQVYGSRTEMRVIQGIKNMVKEGGLRSLWRGNGTSVLKIAPESAIKFGTYEHIKKLFKADSSVELTMVERFAAGSSAGAIAQTAIFPMEVVKTRLAVSKTGQYKGLIDCTMQIFRVEGSRAFFRGYIPNLIGIIPYAGIDLTIYETLKLSYLRKHKQHKDAGVLVLLACGTVSSVCGQLASYPLALVRTKMQAQATDDCKRENTFSLIRSIVKTEGFTGLYRGLLPNFLKALPAVSISYVVYEHTKKALNVDR